MQTIEIDFDVFKALTTLRATEATTYNDVLRQVLQLGPSAAAAPQTSSSPEPSAIGGWTTKGVHFPVGTEFRASYKGELHFGKVVDGGIVVNGVKSTSPSDAARVITHNSVNGWKFWECRLPGTSVWRTLQALQGR